MNWLDLFIGITLMNAMPHYILGIWKGKMLSGFGVGNRQNILWSFANFLLSVVLFIYQYSIAGLFTHQIYLGAAFVLVVFYVTAYFWYRYYYKK